MGLVWQGETAVMSAVGSPMDHSPAPPSPNEDPDDDTPEMATASVVGLQGAAEATKEIVDALKQRERKKAFDLDHQQKRQWFVLRLTMGYASIALLTAVMVTTTYVILNSAQFPANVVNGALAALFVDILGLLVTVWKVVFSQQNP